MGAAQSNYGRRWGEDDGDVVCEWVCSCKYGVVRTGVTFYPAQWEHFSEVKTLSGPHNLNFRVKGSVYR